MVVIVGLILAFTCVVTGFEPCGLPRGCLCSIPVLFSIRCTNVTVFPLFDAHLKVGVLSIHLDDTRLVGLNPFLERDWPNLQEITFRNNTLLACAVIDSLQRDGLLVYSDCGSHLDIITLPILGMCLFIILAALLIARTFVPPGYCAIPVTLPGMVETCRHFIIAQNSPDIAPPPGARL